MGAPRGRRFLTTEQFVAKAIEKRGERYGYGKVEYVDSETKVTFVCWFHGDFQQTPSRHLQGDNCPKCGHAASARKQTGVPKSTTPRHYTKKEKPVEPDFGALLSVWR